MTALPVPRPTVVVPSPRSAFPDVRVPAPRTPADQSGVGRHRAAPATADRPRTRADVGTVAARAGSVVTLAAMLVMAAATAGLTDGVAPTGDAAAVASTTLP